MSRAAWIVTMRTGERSASCVVVVAGSASEAVEVAQQGDGGVLINVQQVASAVSS